MKQDGGLFGCGTQASPALRRRLLHLVRRLPVPQSAAVQHRIEEPAEECYLVGLAGHPAIHHVEQPGPNHHQPRRLEPAGRA